MFSRNWCHSKLQCYAHSAAHRGWLSSYATCVRATTDTEDDNSITCSGPGITKTGCENWRKVLFSDESHYIVQGHRN